MKQIMRTLWSRWKAVAHWIGNFQARTILFVFYYVVLGPFAIGLKLWSDPLRLRPTSVRGWLPPLDTEDDPVAVASRQF
jgi:hypothetical protein